MATTARATVKVEETLDIKTNKVTNEMLTKKVGALSSPINQKEEGETFEATLTGKIEIRSITNAGQNSKGAYFTTKEGYSIKVNAGFDPSVHKENAKVQCICAVFSAEDGRKVKYTVIQSVIG